MKKPLLLVCLFVLFSVLTHAQAHRDAAPPGDAGLDTISIVIGLVVGVIVGYVIGNRSKKK